MRTFTSLLSLTLVFSLFASPLAAVAASKDGFSKGASVSQLQSAYKKDKIRILIAAGHEPGYGGAIYQGMYEREIVTDIAEELESLLEENPKFEVIVTRTDAAWNKDLKKYFSKNEKKIQKFVTAQKKKMEKLLKKGKLEGADDGHGVAAPSDVAHRLYGINKWANENKIDLVVNLHVNDAPDHGPNEPSQHTGYAIYVPDSVYGNSKTSMKLGEEIADHLDKLSNESTHPLEQGGVIPHREFIAVGAFGTLNVPSVLIEYGYITEPRFTLPEHRAQVAKDTAYQTYLGIQDFFGDPIENPRKVKKLPTTWPKPEPLPVMPMPTIASTTPAVAPVVVATTSPAVATPALGAPASPIGTANRCAAFTKVFGLMKDTDPSNGEVKRLQEILAKDKTVYPEGLATGFFGPATERAVKAFQKKQGIVSDGTPETTGYGVVGPKTAAALLKICTP